MYAPLAWRLAAVVGGDYCVLLLLVGRLRPGLGRTPNPKQRPKAKERERLKIVCVNTRLLFTLGFVAYSVAYIV